MRNVFLTTAMLLTLAACEAPEAPATLPPASLGVTLTPAPPPAAFAPYIEEAPPARSLIRR